MPSNAILHEAQQLHKVSDRLSSVAERHPLVSDALVTISEAFVTPPCFGGPGGNENRVIPRDRSSGSLTARCYRWAGLWSLTLGLVVQNDIQERTMNLQAALAIVEEA
jgi:hypothetical protein